MPARRSSTLPLALASLAAGPIFLFATGLAALYLQLPRPVVLEPGEVIAFAALAAPAALVGFVLSLLPNLVGRYLLIRAGGALPQMRRRAVWIATGALHGAALAWGTGAFAQPPYAFGLILTSAACAGICRKSACWE
jgi:hypothetical protein